MRLAKRILLPWLCLPLILWFTGCGSTTSGSFTLSAGGPSVTLAQGTSKSFTVTATGADNFKGSVSVTASGLPAGVTLSPASATIASGASATFVLNASSTAAVGATSITIQGTSGGLSASTPVSVVVTAGTITPPGGTADFTLAVAPSLLSLSAGSNGQVTLTSTAVGGFTGPVTVMLSGLPAGVTASPSTLTVTPGTPQTVTLSADTTVATTTSPAQVSFMGSAGTLQHTATLALSLTGSGAPPGSVGDFQLSLNPSSLSIAADGASQPVQASITALNGFTGPVSVAVTGLPSGVTMTPASPTAVVAGTPQQFRITASATAALGTTNVTFTGTAGGLTHTVQLALTVTNGGPQPGPDFSLALAPANPSAAPGGVAITTMSVTPILGYNGTVSVSTGALPAGVTVSPSSFSVSPTTPQQLTVSVAASVASGAYTIVFTGVSGTTLMHTVILSLTVTAPSNAPDFALTFAPTSTSIAQGGSGQGFLSASALRGFMGQINVTATGVPTGVTLSPSSFGLAPGTPQAVSLTVAANTVPGTYSILFTGISSGPSGSLTHTAILALTVTKAGQGDFALTVTPASLSVTQGGSGSVNFSASASGGFAGSIMVTPSMLPTGIVLTPGSFSLTAASPVGITVAVASTVPTGSYPIVFTGVSGSGTGAIAHSVTLALTVTSSQATADFTITASPTTMTVAQGTDSNEVQIAVLGSNGFNGNIAYTVTGLPPGVASVPSSGTLQAGWTDSVLFRATDSAALGNATITITGTSGALTHSATVALSVTPPPPPAVVTVSLSPSSQTVAVNSFGTVAVTVNGPAGYTGQLTVDLTGLPDGVTASPAKLTVDAGVPQTVVLTASGTAQPGASTVTFTGRVGSIDGTADLSLTVVPAVATGLVVPTWHYDNNRSGLNAAETTLKPANVTSAGFGKLGFDAADGAVDAQPLFVSALTIGAQTHNVIYVATEKDTVYAYDAESGAVLWQTSVLGANEAASDDHGCSEVSPSIGITATPVIDRNYPPNGAIFVVAMSKDSSGVYHQRLHALDLTTGAELAAGPVEIAATYPGSEVTSDGTTNTFDPSQYVERAAMLLSNSTVYLTWASPCGQTSFDYSSWVMSYSEATLQQLSALNLTPNGSGGGIWMSGAGPAADSNGDVYFITSSGTFDTTLTNAGYPQNGDYGNGYVQIAALNGVLSVVDYFEPVNGVLGAAKYADQGSGGLMLVPVVPVGGGFNLSFVIGAGKDGNIYELLYPGTGMGEYAGDGTDHNISTLTGALPNGTSSSPAYFNNNFYYGGIGDSLKEFKVLGQTGPALSQSPTSFGDAGATPVVSANGNSDAVLWAVDASASQGAVLHAYDATNLATELYNSSQAAGSRDSIGASGKFVVPLVIDGHVYVGTQTGVAVFGLLPN